MPFRPGTYNVKRRAKPAIAWDYSDRLKRPCRRVQCWAKTAAGKRCKKCVNVQYYDNFRGQLCWIHRGTKKVPRPKGPKRKPRRRRKRRKPLPKMDEKEGKEEKEEKKIWYDECNNEEDPIMTYDITEYREDEVLKIKMDNKVMCYSKDALSQYYGSLDGRRQPLAKEMRNWVLNEVRLLRGQSMESGGHGGIPGQKVYWLLPPDNRLMTDNARMRILKACESSRSREIRLRKSDEGRIRFGNAEGVFGRGTLHGQLPGDYVYR